MGQEHGTATEHATAPSMSKKDAHATRVKPEFRSQQQIKEDALADRADFSMEKQVLRMFQFLTYVVTQCTGWYLSLDESHDREPALATPEKPLGPNSISKARNVATNAIQMRNQLIRVVGIMLYRSDWWSEL